MESLTRCKIRRDILIPQFEIHQSKNPVEDKDLALIQQNVQKFVRPLEENPLLSGRFIEGVVLVHGATTAVQHKLNRQPRGWFLCDITGDMLESIGRTAWDTQTITFNVTSTGTADITVSLWVF